jgi:7-carboxy-7-deazaguanine synthase
VIYPIAECFNSPQGEGAFAGSLFTFIRFAGCNVGKPYTVEQRAEINAKLAGSELPILAPYMERCETQLGISFSCDTRYSLSYKASVEQLVQSCEGALRVCLTGGEPLLHDLLPLMAALHAQGKKLHLETSGTHALDTIRNCGMEVWIAVSPKIGCLSSSLELADELKILVGPEFAEVEFGKLYGAYMDKVWLQPINYEHAIDMTNVRRCLALQEKYPLCRLSTQAHKLWDVR